MDRIVLTGMRHEARLGLDDDERALPQLVEVDVELEADLAEAARTDDISRTLDYAPVVRAIGATVSSREFRLVEGLAGAITAACLEAAPSAAAITVRVRKLAVPMDVDMDHAEVELRTTREPQPDR